MYVCMSVCMNVCMYACTVFMYVYSLLIRHSTFVISIFVFIAGCASGDKWIFSSRRYGKREIASRAPGSYPWQFFSSEQDNFRSVFAQRPNSGNGYWVSTKSDKFEYGALVNWQLVLRAYWSTWRYCSRSYTKCREHLAAMKYGKTPYWSLRLCPNIVKLTYL